jgi:hypothetical protein
VKASGTNQAAAPAAMMGRSGSQPT